MCKINIFPAFLALLLLLCIFVAGNPHKKHVIIGFEGMPGAGKSSTIFELLTLYPDYVFLSEMNPDYNINWSQLSLSEKSKFFHTKWIERMEIISEDNDNNTYILDRTFYSNLAYKYASSKINNDDEYDQYLKKYYKDLAGYNIELLFVIDIEPLVGLKRRRGIDKSIPAPWNQKQFLQYFREFYRYELPKITNTNIIYIDSTNISSLDLKTQITNTLNKNYNMKIKNKKVSYERTKKYDSIVKYAKNKKILGPSSKMVEVLGYPTIYFQRHSIQFADNGPVVFDNKRLKYLLNNNLNQ